MKLVILSTIACIFSGVCLAQSDERASRIVSAWSDWIDAGDTSVSTIAVLRNGELISKSSVGVSEDTAMSLASLSKAVTATCIAKLSQDERLSMDLTLGALIDAPTSVQDMKIAQLLTHTSGIWPDATQGNANLRDGATEEAGTISQQAMDRDPQMGDIGAFAYNNENYAILGTLIENVTGEPYADFCAKAVLAPLGIKSATMAGKWAAHGSWGGWSMSAPDYARFAWASFGTDSDIGPASATWPSSDVGNGVNYSMGVFWREIRRRYLFWSSGMLCWEGIGDGGYFASYGGEWLVVTLYSDCLAGTERLSDLDRVLFEAAVK